jgi:transposase
VSPAVPDCPGCIALQAQLDAQAEVLAALRQEVAELRARLDRDSSNSSQPPSSGHPHGSSQRPGRPNRAARRKRGGQPGHPGATRTLIPLEETTRVVACRPTTCGQCAATLPEGPSPHDRGPIREQVWELPPLAWELTEYQRHGLTCPECGGCTWGERPPEAPAGCLGFRAQAALALLTGGVQLSRRPARLLAQELLGLPLSLGTLSRVEATVTAALAEPYAEVARAVAAAPVVYCDESPWREPGEKPWLWTATTEAVSLFRIALSRDTAAFRTLLPANRKQTKVTDRYAVYVHALAESEHGVCWAHLDREFLYWSTRLGEAGVVGRWLAAETEQLFAHWHAFKAGVIDRPALAERLEPVRAAVRTALRWGAARRIPKLQGLCRHLLEREATLWTFVRVEGVEPTNNTAERAVRPGVLWRKTSLFTQSERGREYVARMLTVRTTLRRQGGNLLEFLTEALRCHRGGEPPPRLLPVGT